MIVGSATAEEGAPLTPVIPTEEGYSFVYITHSNLLLVAVTKRNSNAMMILTFLFVPYGLFGTRH